MEYKVCSFNLRVDVKVDGENGFPYRKERILKKIMEEKPDLIGFQEVTVSMRAWLEESLTGYVVVGLGREAGDKGESMTIAFRQDKFALYHLEHQWLSLTPQVPGSSYELDQSPYPRMFSAARLCCKADGTEFIFINTHLDHVGQTARVLGAIQLLQYVSVQTLPVILTGDFNAAPDNAAIRLITDNPYFPLRDLTGNLPGTFHNYGKIPPEKRIRIDYIFSNLESDPDRSYMMEDPADGFLSDHNPVCAFVEIGSPAENA